MQPATPETDLLTASEVAAACRVSLSTVSRWVRLGTLPSIQFGGRRSTLRFRRQDVAEFLTPRDYPRDARAADGSAA